MIIYKTETIEQKIMDKFFCDRCKKEVFGDMELQDAYSIRLMGGYASVFGDGCKVDCDLCQQCLKELIGDFCTYNIELTHTHTTSYYYYSYDHTGKKELLKHKLE